MCFWDDRDEMSRTGGFKGWSSESLRINSRVSCASGTALGGSRHREQKGELRLAPRKGWGKEQVAEETTMTMSKKEET